ncbi:integrin beta-7 [Microcaecilia unicolor]|uniref:Integrin beta n=1 Tax=Microcaecilia unicolor TaxID=1415580 RepID=A0A6P7XLH1_9AMPH|nr:integrin beta-7 [Microcaecilia unicolor]
MKGMPVATGFGLLLLLVATGNGEKDTNNGPCKPRASCKECILSHPSCAWCKERNFTKAGEADSSRCATQDELLKRGCDEHHVVNPRSSHEILENKTLSENAEEGEVIQLTPQRIRLKLRPGVRESFTVSFRRAEGYPIDLYYLMDLSYSMKDDLEHIKKLGNDLLAALKNVTKSVKIGFGSFVDKTVLPYVSTANPKMLNPCPDRMEQCQPPFSFKHVLSLTDNATKFELKVSEQNISGNLDSPEGGFDAIMQAAVCTDQIGWRNVTRLLVFTSDDTFHMAGDGKLGGIYMPSDGKCHLNKDGIYQNSNLYDYPSVGHLAHVLSASNIQPIFAVTSTTLAPYQELSELIPKSVVGELKDDSSNVVHLISDAYNNLSSTINLEHLQLPPEIQIWYDSHCGSTKLVNKTRGECSNVKIKEMVNFTVSVEAKKQMCQQQSHGFKIKALGFNEELFVEVEMVCDCACGDDEQNSEHCSGGNGTFSCGVCSCRKNRLGKLCECEQKEHQDSDLEASCRNNSSQLCSGKGRCECGQCICNSNNYHGQFCECDDTSCERHNGLLCGGEDHGSCSCGICICNANYTGTACECSLDTSQCTKDGVVCSGHGRCECNKCKCHDGYFEKLCTQCPDCMTPCQIHKNCTECKAFDTGPLRDTCESSCAHVNVSLIPKQDDSEGWCNEKSKDAFITFKIKEEEGGRVFIKVVAKQEMADQKWNIILGLVLGIVFIGLLLIIIYRITVEVYDRREYARFEKERKNVQWNEQVNNPLYKSATTTVVNPKFNTE